MTVIHLQILIALGCLMGAAGVALTALGAHSRPGAGLESAGSMLLFHAPAVMAATFVLGGFPLGFVAIAGFILGAGSVCRGYQPGAPIAAAGSFDTPRRPAA